MHLQLNPCHDHVDLDYKHLGNYHICHQLYHHLYPIDRCLELKDNYHLHCIFRRYQHQDHKHHLDHHHQNLIGLCLELLGNCHMHHLDDLVNHCHYLLDLDLIQEDNYPKISY